MNLETLVQKKRLIVCVGSGGVGKTTTAASIGLKAAVSGRRVLVLTIDPARRLANALGLSSFGNEVKRIDLPEAAPGGELYALMLDTRTTFDDVIRRVSPDEETRARVLENSIYQIISDSFSSSQDYMAVEKLYDVWTSGQYDLVVLDTPPVKNALDFIEAPGRLARFLDRHIMKWFLRPYDENRVFGRVIVGTSGVVFRLLAVIFGREFLSELSLFFLAFRDLYDGFRERQEFVVKLFSDAQTAFLVVCAPNEASVEVASYFQVEFEKRELPYCGVIVNQVHCCTDLKASGRDLLSDEARHLSADLSPHVAGSLLARLEMAHQRLRTVMRQEERILLRILPLVPAEGILVRIPRLNEPIQSMEGLRQLNEHLFFDSQSGASEVPG